MPLITLEMYCLTGYPCAEGQLVEHGDLLSELKRVQEGLFGGFERELTTPNTLLITGSGVRVPHHPHMRLIGGIFADSRRYIRKN